MGKGKKSKHYRRGHCPADLAKLATCPLCHARKPLTQDNWVSIGGDLLHIFSCRDCVDKATADLATRPPTPMAYNHVQVAIQRRIDEAGQEGEQDGH